MALGLTRIYVQGRLEKLKEKNFYSKAETYITQCYICLKKTSAYDKSNVLGLFKMHRLMMYFNVHLT